MTPTKQIKIVAVAMGLALVTMVAEAEVVVVVSAKSPVKELSNHQVTNIFLGKTSRLPNGETVMPIDRAEGQDLREAFYLKLADMTPAQIKAHWSRIIFTGKGRPPREVTSTKAMKEAISSNPQAIGYLDSSALDNSVRSVLVLP